jgi:hypothetical protein
MDHGDTSFLFAGDAEKKEEGKLLKSDEVKALLDVDVLKAGHHGSDTSSTEEFLGVVKPKCVLVSVGAEGVGQNKNYKHPRASTIRRFNPLVKEQIANMGWRTKPVRAYDAEVDPPEWVDVRIRTGISVTTLDEDVVVRSDGASVKCRDGAPSYSTR